MVSSKKLLWAPKQRWGMRKVVFVDDLSGNRVTSGGKGAGEVGRELKTDIIFSHQIL